MVSYVYILKAMMTMKRTKMKVSRKWWTRSRKDASVNTVLPLGASSGKRFLLLTTRIGSGRARRQNTMANGLKTRTLSNSPRYMWA